MEGATNAQEQEQKIVLHNLEMLNTAMQTLLSSESIGGNAGKCEIDGKRYQCAAANGFADKITGKIMAFNNDVKNRPGEQSFTLRLALSIQKGGFFHIVEFINAEDFSADGRAAIESAIEAYNTAHAGDGL